VPNIIGEPPNEKNINWDVYVDLSPITSAV